MNPIVPIPNDIPLPMPGNVYFFKFLLIFSFLCHILFVNLMVGGSLFTAISQMIGKKLPWFDRLAHEISKTITVNKSLAVVLGVAPLLLINVLYTIHFYSANALTGYAWISIVPMVSIAFLLAYLHKFTWDSEYMQQNRDVHIALAWSFTGFFLFIPLIFLANINLMLFPEHWTEIRGFWSSLLYGNVFPRYFHFLLACVAVTALFLSKYLTTASYPLEEALGTEYTRPEIRRGFYLVALSATALNFIAGPFVLVTLPWKGLGLNVIFIIFIGVAFGALALKTMVEEVVSSEEEIGRKFWQVVALFTLTVAFMGWGRHLYRDNALYDHQMQIAAKTEQYMKLVKEAHDNFAAMPVEKVSTGEQTFKQVCSACHAMTTQLVGPSVKEISDIYKDNPKGFTEWVKKPGKKREGAPQMPAFPLPEDTLNELAAYMIREGQAAKVKMD